MPPKKAAAKAKTATKAAAVPATVTTSSGKEIETTAAAARPKRGRPAANAPPASKATPKKAASAPGMSSDHASQTPTAGRKRGRPAKVTEAEFDVTEPPKKRGRPSKVTAAPTTTPAKKRGQPAKSAAPAVPLNETAPPKKRGRPPKGGETTKIEAAEEAAAEQLEEELVDAVEAEPSKPTTTVKRGRGRPPKPAGRGKQHVEHEAEDGQATADTSGKQYWLMKAEQEDREETLKDGSVFNAKFTIDDLRARNGPEPWDGVRNPTACKNMKDMKLGDLAFFYASGGKKGRVPGITGIMEIVKEHEPDTSAFDENSPFYEEDGRRRGSPEQPRWFMVHVEFRKKLSKPVTLTELKKFAETDRVLSKMQEFTAARLSVSKVSAKEWEFIVNELIEGYEEEQVPTHINGVEANRVEVVKTNEDNAKGNGKVEIPDSDAAVGDGTSSRPPSRAGSKKPGSFAGSKPRGRSRTPLDASVAVGGAEEMEVIPE